MSELQHTDEVVTKQYVAELYQQLLPYLSSSLMVKTGVSDYYTETEQVIGAWKGKPLYQKTLVWRGPFVSGENTITTDFFGTGVTADEIICTDIVWIGSDDTIWIPVWIGTSSGGVIQYDVCRLWKDGTVKVIGNGSWGDAKLRLTVKYTKTTDAAGSATATAGAYDISRPDTWPANTEIYFGKGLYGYRASGNYAANKGANEAGIVNIGITAYRIQSCGGGFEALNASGNRVFRCLGPTVSTGSVLTVFAGNVTIGATNNLVAGFNTGTDTITTAQKYDLWVTYSKP